MVNTLNFIINRMRSHGRILPEESCTVSHFKKKAPGTLENRPRGTRVELRDKLETITWSTGEVMFVRSSLNEDIFRW